MDRRFCNTYGHDWHEAVSPMCEECFEKKVKKRIKQLQADKKRQAKNLEAEITRLSDAKNDLVFDNAQLQANNEKLNGIVVLFDNYCRVNDIDMEQFLNQNNDKKEED